MRAIPARLLRGSEKPNDHAQRARASRAPSGEPHHALRFVLVTWASSRLLFFAAGAIGKYAVTQAYPVGLPREPAGWLNYWANWDGGWFSSIATHGYGDTLWPASTNFFPIYPAIVHVATLLGPGPAVAGVAISAFACLLALFFFYELTEDIFGRAPARAATLSLAFFPTAFYMNAVYSESVFLAAAIGAVWAARVRGSMFAAALLGCVAAGTRNVGVFVVLPLVHEWWKRRETVGVRSLLTIGLVPWGCAAYMFWLWRWSTHPLLFSTVVAQTWGRKLASPVGTLTDAWTEAREGAVWAVHPGRVLDSASANQSFDAMQTYSLIFLGVMLVLLVLLLARGPLGLSLYAFAVLTLPVLTPAFFSALASFPRYALAAFPVFMILGTLLHRSRLALAAWLGVNGAFGVLLAVYFTSWRWVA